MADDTKLPRRWRIVLPLAWVAATIMTAYAGRGEPSISYPPMVTIAIVVGFAATIVVPIFAFRGWKWAPAASVVGAAAGLVPSYSDMREPLPSSGLVFALFAGLMVLGIVALADPRVRVLMRGTPGSDHS